LGKTRSAWNSFRHGPRQPSPGGISPRRAVAWLGLAPFSPSPPPRRRAGDADPRRALGRLGEQIAARHLEGLRFSVLARNVRTRRGEIDLIAFDGATLVFAEVKTRREVARQPDHGLGQHPLEGLRAGQRERLRSLAAAWLHEHRAVRPHARTIRFDAIGVLVDAGGALRRLEHLEGAW
jgi:putative endonuclease